MTGVAIVQLVTKINSMANLRVSLSFVTLPDGGLDEFTSNIITCLTGNASFPTPPVTLDNLKALQTAFANAVTAALQGGPQNTAVKNQAREALLDALRKDAAYVQSLASHDMAILLSSGYYASSTNRAQVELDVPAIVSIENTATRTLTLTVQPVDNAKAYEVQTSTAPGVWQHAATFTSTRSMVLENLAPGTTYTIQVRAVGGATGYSAWSDPVAHMAT